MARQIKASRPTGRLSCDPYRKKRRIFRDSPLSGQRITDDLLGFLLDRGQMGCSFEAFRKNLINCGLPNDASSARTDPCWCEL